MILKSKTNNSCHEVKFEIAKKSNKMVKVIMEGKDITDLLMSKDLIFTKSGITLLLEFHIEEIE